jgi:hypothetical protein
MKVLTTSTSAQEVKVIPRSYPSSITVKVRNESTNDTDTYTSVAATKNKGYLVFSNAFSLTEGNFYNLTLLDGADVIYKGKIFCTDSSDYSVNTNQYVQETSYDNEYIIL